MTEKPEYLGYSECAKRLGMSKSTLWKHVQAGKIRHHDGRLILAEVIEDRAKNVRGMRKNRRSIVKEGEEIPPIVKRPRGRPRKNAAPVVEPKKPTSYDSFSAAQARSAGITADMRLLDYQQKIGALIPRAVAERELFESAREIRDAWQVWPSRVCELMAAAIENETGAKVDARALGVILNDFVRDQLDELAGTAGPGRQAA